MGEGKILPLQRRGKWGKPGIRVPAFLAFPANIGKDLETIKVGEASELC